MLVPEGITNFAVYGDNNEFFGIAEAQLPKITHMTETIKGAGIAGEIESVFLGHVSAMEMTLSFRTLTKETMGLATPEQHQLELRAAQQSRAQKGGKLTTTAVKYVVIGQAKETDPGKLAPAATADASVTFAVTYLAVFVAGEKVMEVDPLNFIFYMGGTDYLAETRKALGK